MSLGGALCWASTSDMTGIPFWVEELERRLELNTLLPSPLFLVVGGLQGFASY